MAQRRHTEDAQWLAQRLAAGEREDPEQSRRRWNATRWCEARRDSVLTADGIGVLRLGHTATLVKAVCPQARDSSAVTFHEAGGEWAEERMLRVARRGVELLINLDIGGVIIGIDVLSPGIRATNGMAVGDPIRRFARRSPDLFAWMNDHGPGILVADPSACAYRVWIDGFGPTRTRASDVAVASDIRRWDANIRIERIGVAAARAGSCPRSPPAPGPE